MDDQNQKTEKRKISTLLTAVIVTSGIVSAATSAVMISVVLRKGGESFNGAQEQNGSPQTSSHEAAVEAAVEKSSFSVVSVVATKDLPVLEQYFTNPFGNDDFFNQFFPFRVPQYRQNGTQRREVAGGSGFVVSADGLVLTNRHVVDVDDADFTVVFSDGTKIEAEVLAIDPVEDLAVLRVDRTGLTSISLGNSDALKIGQSVIAIGNALGEFQNTVSVGVVAGLNRRISAGDGSGATEVIEGAIQTDAAINPGNSGGPLLNLHGEAIGINTAIVVGSQNIGFAIPINKAKKAISDVQATGKISYAYLGVRHVPVTEEVQKSRGLPVDYGALIVGSADGKEPGVAVDSPAAKAGLREGDVILSVNSERVNEERSLSTLIQQHKVGEAVTLRVFSNGQERDIPVTLGERP